jgi:chloramphenicol O-acetyltransferase type A
MSYHKLDIDNWPRKDHFNFFREFEEPFFGVSVHIDCTGAYARAKETNSSFFLYYLYQSLVAANSVENFRYRIRGEEVLVFDKVNASSTINRADQTFGFSYMDYYDDFDTFVEHAVKEIDRVQNSKGLIPAISGENVIHYTALPWIDFTSISHARSFSFRSDSCPKIAFGKMKEVNGRRQMAFSIHAHHALMDGYHVGLFLEKFQELMA